MSEFNARLDELNKTDKVVIVLYIAFCVYCLFIHNWLIGVIHAPSI